MSTAHQGELFREIAAINLKLGEISGSVKSLVARQDQRDRDDKELEGRVDKLESHKDRATGRAGVTGAVVGAVMAIAGSMLTGLHIPIPWGDHH